MQDRAGDHGMDELGADADEITAGSKDSSPRRIRLWRKGSEDSSESIAGNSMKQFIYRASFVSFPLVGNPS